MNIRGELEEVGVDSQTADRLALLVRDPPPGTLDREDVAPETRAALVLRAALIASVEWRTFSPALSVMIDWLECALDELSGYDSARFWHLRALSAWRVDDSITMATRALNASMRLLGDDPSERARRFLPRVLDTSGQLLHHQGLFHDARRELERALALRDGSDDRAGTAITLGNLGRLCMDFGDFVAAAAYLGRDIVIVEELMPERTRIRSQLLTHLAHCKLRLGDEEAADTILATSAQLAREAGDGANEVFAIIGQGAVMLARGDTAGALRVAEEASGKIARERPSKFRSLVLAAAERLSANARARTGDHDGAIAKYQAARCELLKVPGASPIEHADILRSLAAALSAKGEAAESARSLRLALEYLDATAVEAMRGEVERELKRTSYDSWLLHSAGRFVGRQQIELLLSEAGQEGFRGERRRVTVMFSDIRGFTAMSERLSPDQLIHRLNDFLTQMTRCIDRQGGIVDKFIGDAVMAVFPINQPNRSATDALVAALAMRDEVERFNRDSNGGFPKIAIGIGLHAGEVIAGLIGSPQKRAYTVIGDVVNTASRIEGMTKQLGASILVTSEALEGADINRFLLRPLGRYTPKGRTSALRVFDLIGERDRSPASRAAEAEIARASEALAMFTDRDFARAAEAFLLLEQQAGASPSAAGYALLASQSKRSSLAPPAPEWLGEVVLIDK